MPVLNLVMSIIIIGNIVAFVFISIYISRSSPEIRSRRPCSSTGESEKLRNVQGRDKQKN